MRIRLAALACVALALLVLPVGAGADCALVPAAARQLPSFEGSVGAPIGVPGSPVQLFADNACNGDPSNPFFAESASDNQITITFMSPGGTNTVFPPFAASDVGQCDDPGVGGGATRCYRLDFVVPDTTDFGPLAGTGEALTGPARIQVRNTAAIGDPVVADIGPLFEPTVSCNQNNRFLHPFANFTVLPPRNVFDESATQLRGTVDGTGALIVPFDYAPVLVGESGSANLRVLSVVQDLDDGLDADTTTRVTLPQNSDVFAAVQAFSIDGRPIPPVLEVDSNGTKITGTVDFVDSVIRFANTRADGSPIFDYGSSLLSGVGPVVLGDGTNSTVAGFVDLEVGGAAQLSSLAQSENLTALARDEALEGQDFNFDGDQADKVFGVIDTDLGLSLVSFRALSEISRSPARPVVVTDGGITAGVVSEARDGGGDDLNGDGDAVDDLLAGVTVAFGEGYFLEDLFISPNDGVVDVTGDLRGQDNVGRPVAVSQDNIFFLSTELDNDSPLMLDLTLGVPEIESLQDNPDVSATGFDGLLMPHAVFEADLTDGESSYPDQILMARTRGSGFRRALVSAPITATSCDDSGDGASSAPAIDDGGNVVVFDSFATNLLATASSGRQVFRAIAGFDESFNSSGCELTLRPSEMLRVSENRVSGVQGDGSSFEAAVSGDGQHVAFSSNSTNLLVGSTTGGLVQVFVYDVAADRIELVSRNGAGAEANGAASSASLSKDGRFVAFDTTASNLLPADPGGGNDVYVVDRDANENGTYDEPGDFAIELVSVASDGTKGNGSSFNPSLSADGRYVAFDSNSTNLVDDDTNASSDVFVHDRETGTTERVSVTTAGAEMTGTSRDGRISGDARRVAFESDAALSVLDTNVVTDVYRFDRVTRVQEIVSVPTGEGGGSAQDEPSQNPAISANGRTVVFASDAEWLTDSDSNLRPDIFVRRSSGFGPSFNDDDSDLDDTVLRALDSLGYLDSSQAISRDLPPGTPEVSVAGGRAMAINDFGESILYDPDATTTQVLEEYTLDVALSDQMACLVSEATETPRLYMRDPQSLIDFGASRLIQVSSFEADDVQAVDDKCVVTSLNPSLRIVTLVNDPIEPVLVPFVVDTCLPAVDFQVASEGIAFRTCEFDLVPPTDGNGDGDVDDCNINFWDFSVPVDETCDTDPLVQSGFSAVPCDIDGCDPFFEPYRLRNGRLSFTTREGPTAPGSGGTEENVGGAGKSPNCLPTSGPDVCDLNADADDEDLVVVVIPLASCATGDCKEFIYTPDPEGGTQPPFPNDDGLIVMNVDGDTVIVGDADGDGSPDFDGVLDGDFDTTDSCPDVPNPDQADLDDDGLGAACDGAVGDGNSVDNPGQSVCDLNRSGTITTAELSQIFDDRGLPIPAPVGGVPRDNRDPDADGQITVLDVRACKVLCDAQPGGCAATEPPPSAGCGLLGIEALLALLLRRRSGPGDGA